MIYIDSNSTTVKFPRVATGTPVKIKFQNQTTKKEFEVEVANTSTTNTFYTFNFADHVWLFEPGQYNYWIVGTEVLATGILQFDDFEGTPQQYTANVSIVQYDPD